MKTVAIILATYNGEKYLEEQLESLKRQTYSNIHVYIHDDESSDRTLSIINKYVHDTQNLVKFTLWNQEKLGYPQCFIRTLLSVPKADYYAFCDQDDVWFDNKVEDAVMAIEKYGEDKPTLFYSAVDYYDDNLEYIRSARFKNTKKKNVDIYKLHEMLLGGEALGMTFLFNNFLREKIRYVVAHSGTEFKDIFIKIYAASCGIVIYSYDACAKYRRHSSATTVGMNPANTLSRFVSMSKMIFFDSDGMEPIQSSVDYINKYLFDDILLENSEIIELFSKPNSFKKKIKKVFWPERFRLKYRDEIGYRVAFLIGRI